MINMEEIISILAEWNFWGKGLETGIERRHYTSKILSILEARVNKIVTLFGVRRSGKSFILRQIARSLSEKYGERNVLYVNFEEPNIPKDLEKIYKAYMQIVKPSVKIFLLLDEIQEVREWERWVRSVHEKGKTRIIATGSSAKLMSEELATLLAGRDIPIEVFPLSFREFLEFNKIEIEGLLEILSKKNEILGNLRDYLKNGGFPEVVLEKEEFLRKEIVERYVETILVKDVVKRFKVRESEKLEFLANFYLTNFSSLISFNKLSRFLKIPVKTVERFSKFLATSRIIFFISRFSYSLREKEASPRKVYVIDQGLPAFLNFSENTGKFMENCVAVELLRRYSLENIFYFKTREGYEVDFLVKEGPRIKQLIQVSYANSFDEIDHREIRALLHSREVFKKDKPKLLVITWDYEDEREISWFGKRGKIRFVPLWRWLLT